MYIWLDNLVIPIHQTIRQKKLQGNNSIWIEHSTPTTTPLHSKPHLCIMTSPHTQRPELAVMHVRKPEYVPHLLQEHRAFHLPARTKFTKHHVIAYTESSSKPIEQLPLVVRQVGSSLQATKLPSSASFRR